MLLAALDLGGNLRGKVGFLDLDALTHLEAYERRYAGAGAGDGFVRRKTGLTNAPKGLHLGRSGAEQTRKRRASGRPTKASGAEYSAASGAPGSRRGVNALLDAVRHYRGGTIRIRGCSEVGGEAEVESS